MEIWCPEMLKGIVEKREQLLKRGTLEARGGIEPPIEVLQTSALPLGYRAFESRSIELPTENNIRFPCEPHTKTTSREQERQIRSKTLARPRGF